MLLDAPGPLILTSAVIGFVGTVLFPVGLYWLNYCWIIPDLPAWARPGRADRWLLAASFLAYLLLAAGYLRVTLAR